jgi:hypothetical protein
MHHAPQARIMAQPHHLPKANITAAGFARHSH